tara:strand:- start:834 stop:1055 length:222 start_codon:yes stop_codon:yes gene_type:complete
METLKRLQKLDSINENDDKMGSEKEFFYTTKDENYILKEKIKDLQCLVYSLQSENEKLIKENVRLIDAKKSKS